MKRRHLFIFIILSFFIGCGIDTIPPTDGSIDLPAVIDPPEGTYCGDTICDTGWEDFLLCPTDCLPFCGDGTCSPEFGETILSCFRDCKPRAVNIDKPFEIPGEQVTDPPGDIPCPISIEDRMLPRWKTK